MAEKEDSRNSSMKGVRTYFFNANHWRGLPHINTGEDSHYDDYVWIPKRKMNEYLTRDYYDIFADACSTR